MAQSEEKKAGEKPAKKPKTHEQLFKESWILALMKNMEEQLDERTRTKLMETCGRNCARRGAISMAESSKGNVGNLVQSLAKFLGKENCYQEGNVVHLAYQKCYCELVAEGPEKLPDTYCHCSQGWLLEIFETAAQKPVKVEILQTIKRGAPTCKFLVRII